MAGPFRERIFGVAIKLETTSGTDSVPTMATDGVVTVGIPTLEYDFMESGDRDDAQTGIMSGPDRAQPAGAYGRISIQVEIRGAGAVYTSSVKPPADALWQMSGFSSVLGGSGGSEQYLYTTLDDLMKTASCYFWSEHRLFKMVGAVAQPRLTAEVYKRGMATFNIQGKITSIADAALPASPPLGTIPPLFHSAAAAIGSFTSATAEPLMLLAAAVDFGNVVGDISSAGATDGLIGWLITDRKVTQDLTYIAPSFPTFDPYGRSAAIGGPNAPDITAWQLGSIQYNRINVQARWAPAPPRKGSRNGLATYQQSGICRVGSGLTGGREIELKYY